MFRQQCLQAIFLVIHIYSLDGKCSFGANISFCSRFLIRWKPKFPCCIYRNRNGLWRQSHVLKLQHLKQSSDDISIQITTVLICNTNSGPALFAFGVNGLWIAPVFLKNNINNRFLIHVLHSVTCHAVTINCSLQNVHKSMADERRLKGVGEVLHLTKWKYLQHHWNEICPKAAVSLKHVCFGCRFDSRGGGN